MATTPNLLGNLPLLAQPAVAPIDGHPVPVQGANTQQTRRAVLAASQGLLGRMSSLPAEVMADIGGLLPPRDGMRWAVAGTQNLPPQQQAPNLSALATQIHSLPPEDWATATHEFLAALSSLPAEHRTPELMSLAHIAEHSVGQATPFAAARRGENVQHTALFYDVTNAAQIQSLELAAVFSREPGSAGAAVRGGRDVQEVATESGVLSERGIRSLKLVAAASDHHGQGLVTLLESSSTLHAVPEGPLELIAAHLAPADVMSVRVAVIQGLQPSQQAWPLSALALQIHSLPPAHRSTATTQFLAAYNSLPAEHRTPELTSLAHIATHSLVTFSARAAAYQSTNAQHAALFYGVTSDRAIMANESVVAHGREPGSAGAAVGSGQRVDDVANDFGLLCKLGIECLELSAVASTEPGSAGHAVRSGMMSADEAHSAFGFVTEYGRAQLNLLAARFQNAQP
jgi:hypothetical protein